MSAVRRVLTQNLIKSFNSFKTSGKSLRCFGTEATVNKITQDQPESNNNNNDNNKNKSNYEPYASPPGRGPIIPEQYRFIYPEFLPDPAPQFRNAMREKLERMDMLSRRKIIDIPEFYVGSILAVTYSEPHAPGKSNRFVGICIQRAGCGLRADFLLRNVIDHLGVEVRFDMYDPAIQKIECLRLEKRLDDELLYLRDAPNEFSTFPVDMEPEYLPEGAPVPVNKTIVPLKPLPWGARWEQKDMKGLSANFDLLNKNRQRKREASAKPWEKYDLMKIYRETIPDEEQQAIYSEVYMKLRSLELSRKKLKRKRGFVRPTKKA